MPRKILLFIPGYYGSVLKEEETGKIRWAKVSNFVFSNTGLAENIPGTTLGSSKKLIVDGVLKNVTVLPKYWDVDAYKKTTEQLRDFSAKNEMEFIEVSYDWRDDFVACLKTIDQKINGLNLDVDDQLMVVSHSMGALLTTYYLRYGAQDVDVAVENWEGARKLTKVALIAPPLHGLMILFRDIEDGTRLAVNRNLLSALDYSIFKSTYFFLPPKGEDLGMKKNGENVTIGIHDIDKWDKNNWGLFKFAKASERKIVKEYTETHLRRSEKFHELLRATVEEIPPMKMSLLHIRGLGHKTKEVAILRPTKKRLNYIFNKRSEVDGDGTVTAKSGASLSFFKNFNFKAVDSNLSHLDVLAKPESQKIIQDFILSQQRLL